MTLRYGEFTEVKIHYVRRNCYVLHHRECCLEKCPFRVVFQKFSVHISAEKQSV